jgi:hypothetical protein
VTSPAGVLVVAVPIFVMPRRRNGSRGGRCQRLAAFLPESFWRLRQRRRKIYRGSERENRSTSIDGFHLLASRALFRSRTRADRAGRDARRLRCRRTRNDRRIGLFIRRAGQILKKIRGIRVAARFLQNWTLSGLAHRRAGSRGGVYERLTPPEQIAGIETAKFIEEGKEIFHSPDKLRGTIG